MNGSESEKLLARFNSNQNNQEKPQKGASESEIDKKIQFKKDAIDALERELASKKAEVEDNLSKILAEAKIEADKISNLTSKSAKFREEIKKIDPALKKRKKESKALSEEIDIIKDDLADLKLEIESDDQALNETRAKLASKLLKIKKKEEKLQKLNDKISLSRP